MKEREVNNEVKIKKTKKIKKYIIIIISIHFFHKSRLW